MILSVISNSPIFLQRVYILSRARTRKGAHDESSSLLNPGRSGGRPTEQQTKIVKAVLYAIQVFYSFFIM
jgi:copper transporter 1